MTIAYTLLSLGSGFATAFFRPLRSLSGGSGSNSPPRTKIDEIRPASSGMAFDAIETTVANALLLKAQMGETEPIILKTKLFAELASYTEKALAELTLSNLLQEPLGKYCFNSFLAKNKKDALLSICTDIRLIRGASGKSKRSRGLKIVNGLSEENGVSTALHPSSITVRVNRPEPDAASELSKSIQAAPNEKVSTSAPIVANKLTQPQDSANAASISGDNLKARQMTGNHGKSLSNREGSQNHVNQVSQDDSDDDTLEQKVVHLQSSVDMKTEVEDALKRPSIKPNATENEKAIDRIKVENQAVNENPKQGGGLHLSISKEPSSTEGASNANKPVIAWNPIFTKDIPDYALETLGYAIHNPEKFESDRMMEIFELIYGVLYNELNLQWFPKFLKSGEPFETYICHREYAETSKVGFDNFQMFRALGKGAFGMVSAVQKKDTKKVYAMKAMSKRKIKHYHSEKLCEIEKAALQKVESPFILNLKYSFTNEKNIFLVLALCNGGDLQYHLTEVRGHRFSESRAQFYAAEVILALEHLHRKKFVYRDLKPGNILIDSDGHIVLSDLGLVHRISSKRPLRTLAGTSGYWAPEVMKRQAYDYTADWWSFGIFLHKLLSGRRPKCDCKKPKQWCPFGTKKEHAEMAKLNEPMTFDLVFDSMTFSKDAQDLLRRLLEPDPNKRLGVNGADEVKRHPFFADVSWMELAEKQVEPPFKPTRNDINAVSLGEISSEGDRKFKKVLMDEKDDTFYEKWDYVSVKTVQEEIVAAFERNLELQKKPAKMPAVKESNTQCCVIL